SPTRCCSFPWACSCAPRASCASRAAPTRDSPPTGCRRRRPLPASRPTASPSEAGDRSDHSDQSMKLLGISCFYHDSAACLIDDGRVVAAAQEERFTRKKHDEGFPHHAVRYCLAAGGIVEGAGLDGVAFYD